MGLTENLEKMLESGKDDALLRFGLGNAYFQNKDYARAIEHLEKALEFDQAYSAAWKLLGKAHMRLDELDTAGRVFQAGIGHAEEKGDKQAVREMQVFLKKIEKLRKGAT